MPRWPGRKSRKRTASLKAAEEKEPRPKKIQVYREEVGPQSVKVNSKQPRKLTIPELKAICSFPPDYDIKGSYAQQWAVCGMSVPPLMMFEIAKAVEAGLNGAEVRREPASRIRA